MTGLLDHPVRVEKCPRCPTMKAAGTRHHGAMLRERDNLKCKHGACYWSDCAGRIPPPCCWGDYKTGPTGATPRDEAQQRLAAFEADVSGRPVRSGEQ